MRRGRAVPAWVLMAAMASAGCAGARHTLQDEELPPQSEHAAASGAAASTGEEQGAAPSSDPTPSAEPAAEPAEVEDPDLPSAQLLARSRYHDYDQSTFSFEHGVHRDPDRSLTRNDWDLTFGNGRDLLSVSMSADDRSRLVDLGELRWRELDVGALVVPPPHPEPAREPSLLAVLGHLYLVRTVDSDSELTSVFRVEELVSDERVVITWKVLFRGPPPAENAPDLDSPE